MAFSYYAVNFPSVYLLINFTQLFFYCKLLFLFFFFFAPLPVFGSQNLRLPSWCSNCTWEDSLTFLPLELVPFLPCFLAPTGDQQKSWLALPVKPQLTENLALHAWRKLSCVIVLTSGQCTKTSTTAKELAKRWDNSTVLIKPEHSALSLRIYLFPCSPSFGRVMGRRREGCDFASHLPCHTLPVRCGL